MPPKVELGDPGDLFFGLHDLATRVRSLHPAEELEWASIVSYLAAYIKYMSSLCSAREVSATPLSGGMQQGVIVALHALEIAARSARKRNADSTADAIDQASRAIRNAGNLSLPSIAAEK